MTRAGLFIFAEHKKYEPLGLYLPGAHLAPLPLTGSDEQKMPAERLGFPSFGQLEVVGIS